jgi:hypothetical protein
MSDTAWPAGHPDEAAIRAQMAHDLEVIDVKITRGDLKRLDRIIVFVEAMASFFSSDYYDDLWNMRNGMVPFEPDHPLAIEDEE